MSSCMHEHHDSLHGVHDHHNVASRLAEAETFYVLRSVHAVRLCVKKFLNSF